MMPPDLRSVSQNKSDLQPLVALGLTQREAEVLTWVARGKSNYEIGVILGAASHTIRKHVEHILSKLNVENRTAAAAIVFTTCSQFLDLF
jgi:DNA-binding CsgD family transcriptional regulator